MPIVEWAQRDLLDQGGQQGRRGSLAPEAVGINRPILRLQKLLEGVLMRRRSIAVALLDIARQQHIELSHAATAAPAQFAELAQWRRRARICLISLIALAGLRSFGQASVQFMMVWHRYNLNGSSRLSSRSPLASSRLSTIHR